MYRAGTQNLASRNSPPDPADPAKVAYGPQLATPLPRGGGKDDLSSKETPSNKMYTCQIAIRCKSQLLIIYGMFEFK